MSEAEREIVRAQQRPKLRVVPNVHKVATGAEHPITSAPAPKPKACPRVAPSTPHLHSVPTATTPDRVDALIITAEVVRAGPKEPYAFLSNDDYGDHIFVPPALRKKARDMRVGDMITCAIYLGSSLGWRVSEIIRSVRK